MRQRQRASHEINRRHSRRRTRVAFVLMEVLVSMTILGIAAAVFLRSFNLSIKAAHRMEVITQANFFAMQLLDEFEITPPEEGLTEAGFGDDYPDYFYRVEMTYVEPEYDVDEPDDIEKLFEMRELNVEIFFDDGMHAPFRAVRLDTAIMGLEKFTRESKESYLNY